jgi:hypothetical protein
MARLIYTALQSLDGYVADREGKFDWAAPDKEVHAFVNNLERHVGTYLYGRRMYEVMMAWKTIDPTDQPPHIRDFAEIWGAADKIVYSRTLERHPPPGRGSSGTSIRKRSGRSRPGQRLTSPWPVPSSPLKRSGPGWSTSATCSSRPSWWEAASSPSRATSG